MYYDLGPSQCLDIGVDVFNCANYLTQVLSELAIVTRWEAEPMYQDTVYRLNFGNLRKIREKNLNLLPGPRRNFMTWVDNFLCGRACYNVGGQFMTSAVNYQACGDCCNILLCKEK